MSYLKIYFLILSLFLFFGKTIAQENTKEASTNFYNNIEKIEKQVVHPSCREVEEKFKRDCLSKNVATFVSENFRVKIGNRLNLSGIFRIRANFEVDEKGKITNIEASSTEPKMNREVERILRKLPKMTPGEAKGKKVRVNYTLPIVLDYGFPEEILSEEDRQVVGEILQAALAEGKPLTKEQHQDFWEIVETHAKTPDKIDEIGKKSILENMFINGPAYYNKAYLEDAIQTYKDKEVHISNDRIWLQRNFEEEELKEDNKVLEDIASRKSNIVPLEIIEERLEKINQHIQQAHDNLEALYHKKFKE